MFLNQISSRDTKRGFFWFLVMYIFINIPAFGLYLALVAISGAQISPPSEIMQDPSYILAHQLYPVLNFGFWTLASWLYFRKSDNRNPTIKNAIQIGLFWLALALPLDLIFYVLLPTPFTISFSDFYYGQSPWIYLTYLSLILSPLCYLGFRRK